MVAFVGNIVWTTEIYQQNKETTMEQPKAQTLTFSQQSTFTREALDKCMKNYSDFETAIEFFVAFARFEYALKSSGYIRRGYWFAEQREKDGENSDYYHTSPDWFWYCKELQRYYKNRISVLQTPEAKRLFDLPPKVQALKVVNERNDILTFHPDGRKGQNLWRLLQLVNQVRNNLFHGGKMYYSSVLRDQQQMHVLRQGDEQSAQDTQDPVKARDKQLVIDSILNECSALSQSAEGNKRLRNVCFYFIQNI